MLMTHGTRIRSEAEMEELLAHFGFKLVRALGPRSALRLFEGEPP
jgi:capsular polysaccharide biosynthesis protein